LSEPLATAANPASRQLDLIQRRCADDRFNTVPDTPEDVLIANLSTVIAPHEFADKDVLEIGAGCSVHLKLFLDFGCRSVVANDLVAKRLALIDTSDPRCTVAAGDFLEAPIAAASIDIVFAHLTMMWVVPMHDAFLARINRILRPGGCLVTFDANYVCPLSIWRRFADRTLNPSRLYSPFAFARRAARHGFQVARLVPLTTSRPQLTGNWLLGTSFMMRAEKRAA